MSIVSNPYETEAVRSGRIPIVREDGTPVDLAAEWGFSLQAGIQNASGLKAMQIPNRSNIVGSWLKEGDLGFIYGPRGLGKTWLAMLIARRCAEGGSVGIWPVHRPRKVLYVDGEMPLDGILARDALLAKQEAEGMHYLQHEALFHQTGKVLNLSNQVVQAELMKKCRELDIEVLILDNLSCLFSGIKENDANDWEMVLPWLLEFRRNRITVIILAHAGRNGHMRGTSRREDAAFWVIQLTEVSNAGEIQEGSRFVARFVKNRNATEEECPAQEWSFVTAVGSISAEVICKTVSGLELLRQWVGDGLTNATDIAAEMGISKGQVSKLAKKAMNAGWLKKEGREYALQD